MNVILSTDAYKISHHRLYPPGMTSSYSYFESRGSELFKDSVFFGLQYILKRHLEGQIVTRAKIDEAEELFATHFGRRDVFNRAGWDYIRNEYDGRLPVRIKAVREGTIVPTRNVLMTTESTDPKVAWLPNYLETLLVQVWYPMTVATQSREMKRILLNGLIESGDPSLIQSRLHDFGYRGSTSDESAAIGGAAHLVNFQGTDTLAAIQLLRNDYYAPMAGFSIPATEHSTIMSWGREGELAAYRNVLERFPDGMVACVSDTYDVYRACHLWGEQLHGSVNSRQGTLVVRPDSGDPAVVLPAICKILAGHFGFTVNAKGYNVLSPKVRIIQGDGVDFWSLKRIIAALLKERLSLDNFVFGSGGGLLQKVNRDTLQCAFKLSEVVVNGETREVRKTPIGDKSKYSKAGRLALVRRDGTYATITGTKGVPVSGDLLETVFDNGSLTCNQTFDDIRERAELFVDRRWPESLDRIEDSND